MYAPKCMSNQENETVVGSTSIVTSIPTGPDGAYLGGNGTGVLPTYKYWIPALGIGTDTGSAPASALLVQAARQTTPTVKGVHIGEGGTGDYAIEIVAAAATNNSYIDFTIPNNDFKGRLLYDHTNSGFQLLTNSGNASFYFNQYGALGFGGGSLLTTNYGSFNQVLQSRGSAQPPTWVNANVIVQPTAAEYVGPAIGSASNYTTYTHTIASGSLYTEFLLVAGGGRGGDVKLVATGQMALGGGGASGGWTRVRLPRSVYGAGTVVTITVGAGANTANGAGGGYDTYIEVAATVLAGARGGLNGQDFFNVNVGTGAGGGATVPYNYMPASRLVDFSMGRTGNDAYQNTNIGFAGQTGGGQHSAYGSGARAISFSTVSPVSRNGSDAANYGAGGEGAVSINTTQYRGGAGSPGVARVITYYQ